MKNMNKAKKALIALLVIGSVSAAGTALARDGHEDSSLITLSWKLSGRPVAESPQRPPVRPEDQKNQTNIKRPEPPKDGRTDKNNPGRPPVSGDRKDFKRPEPPSSKNARPDRNNNETRPENGKKPPVAPPDKR